MKRFELQITEELSQVLDKVLNGRPRNPAIEDWLWRTPAIRQAAKRLGVSRKPRRKRGRPKEDV